MIVHQLGRSQLQPFGTTDNSLPRIGISFEGSPFDNLPD